MNGYRVGASTQNQALAASSSSIGKTDQARRGMGWG